LLIKEPAKKTTTAIEGVSEKTEYRRTWDRKEKERGEKEGVGIPVRRGEGEAGRPAVSQNAGCGNGRGRGLRKRIFNSRQKKLSSQKTKRKGKGGARAGGTPKRKTGNLQKVPGQPVGTQKTLPPSGGENSGERRKLTSTTRQGVPLPAIAVKDLLSGRFVRAGKRLRKERGLCITEATCPKARLE